MAAFKRCNCSNHSRCEHPWHLAYKPKGGKRVKQSLLVAFGTSPQSKTDAEKLQPKFNEEIESALREGRVPFVVRVATTVNTFADLLLKHYMPRVKSADTLDEVKNANLRSTYRILLADFGTLALPQLQGEAGTRTVEDYKKKCLNTGFELSTTNRRIANLRIVLRWGHQHEYLTGSLPVFKIDANNETKRHRRLAVGEEDALLSAATAMESATHYGVGKKIGERIAFALDTGLRLQEMLNCQREDIDYAKGRIRVPEWKIMAPDFPLKKSKDHIVLKNRNGEVTGIKIRNTKGKKARELGMTERVREILDRYRFLDPKGFIFGNPDGTYVEQFKGSWNTCKLLAHGFEQPRRKYGTKIKGRTDAAKDKLETIDLVWHDLRHEAASRWYFEKGVPLKHVQELLGHATLEQTQRYLNVSDQDMSGAFALAFGPAKDAKAGRG